MVALQQTVQHPLAGRRAFLTGGAHGIGAAIARQLAGAGAELVIVDIDIEAASRLAAEIGARAVALDVTDLARVGEVIAAEGPFQILVNNIGVDQHAYFTQTTPADWRRLLAVNLESVFATTHAALPAMQAAGFGRIVNIASEAGRIGSRGAAVYAAAKGGVIAFTIKALQVAASNGWEMQSSPWDASYVHTARIAAKRAYAEAGITNPRREIGMTEVHDCFSIAELVTMEDLFLSPAGGALRDPKFGLIRNLGGQPSQNVCAISIVDLEGA